MLDSVSYLTSLGWGGKGNGLREGGASRPLAIPQKRTLAGLGKDRDEAFPFWDHLFTAAAKSIKIKLSGDDDEDQATAGSLSETTLLRTTTGILSNRRPVSLTSGTSGTATPAVDDSAYAPRLSLLAIAKRDTARKRLYASFFRGPVLGPELDAPQSKASVMTVDTRSEKGGRSDVKTKHENVENVMGRKSSNRGKKGKTKDVALPRGVEQSQERKKKKRKISDDGHMASEDYIEVADSDASEQLESKDEKSNRKSAKTEQPKRKEERRKARAERHLAREERRQRKKAKRNAVKSDHA